jgi:hypothetical protein
MFRAQVCDHCTHRTPVTGPNGERECQSTCGQYQAVPTLYDIASRLDPMIASVPDALNHHMPVTGGTVQWPARRRQKVIGLIRRYFDA